MKASFPLYLDRFSRWIRDVLSDDGNQSTMRLVMLLAWTCVLLVWSALCLLKWELLSIPQSVVEILVTGTAGKCWQNHVEAKRRVDTPPQG